LKIVILAGGLGTRLSEETVVKPKPMVEIGSNPIIWHIMNIYGFYGFNDFLLALGYKGDYIKNYFMNYYNLQSDLKISLKTGEITVDRKCSMDWDIHLVDTGNSTMTGGRIKRLEKEIGNESFMVTYGDGVADVDIKKLYDFHKSHGKIGTITAVRPAARFGEMMIVNDNVTEFKEKPQTMEGWINGGFMIFNKEIFDYISDDTTILEAEPLEKLSKDGQLMAYKHYGFWQCMDTIRDKQTLEALWNAGTAPWKMWN
jgi:glucose-1-phosphate cytidylyltransferase